MTEEKIRKREQDEAKLMKENLKYLYRVEKKEGKD